MAENTFQPGTGVAPATLIELSISCRNLIDSDVFSKSDPSKYILGRTEIIWNNLNPDFVKKFVMHYYFEQSQKLKFEIYDVDSKSADLSKHDFLGRMECTLGEIVASGTRYTRRLLGPKKNSGTIIVGVEELSSCKEQGHFQFRASKLDKKDFFGKSDPFLTFSRANEDSSFTVVHRTEVIKKTLNPTWKPFTISVRALCNGDYDRSIKVECYDWDADGGHDFIGEFQTTLRELSRGPSQQNVFECINAKKRDKKLKKGKSYTNSGVIELMSCKMEKGLYIFGLSSNGDPKSPSSLHYMNPYRPNSYQTALRSVGEIIKDYDSDKLFPVLGFGARLPPDGVVSHEFALNGNPNNPYCTGIEGVLEAYNKALHSIQLYGPTNFAPCINHVSRFAEAKTGGSDYFILLIVTDGIITDMPQTCEAIVHAASLPMSIIIVGVGDADFEAMDILDGDDVRLSSRGKYAERDIVQFVPMRNFTGRQGDNPAALQAMLAKEVLEEIPDQFLSYMKTRNIKPKPPLQRQLTISSVTSLPASEQ
ncbi:Protein BONZAI 1,Copine-3,Copine-8,Nicotinic receptor-associated protein 1,Copine-5,Copine-2,Copine-4,Copine-1,Copine-6,Copine-7,Copine-A,Copine-9 [Mytilus coruscus]|uniref:Protein BONZAI 1,Copine-3,Copine-8,Nicotinic receptor-associated protein 1,Copine-5,Copine-2,Copine-4,Copine-1,Copine-6,Copine-7,Cop ine-A,Copine-9 n=1 Tax=Mytilus coruscus TaxID=42192 RepID=A0A6J8DLM6_MYTCO|nr:Protein BONZAI 1,Copine-3,Copine-8,Nicotinic receptor-associated protein 1,Copine-5,Copine-2,Copine-4,Copine-1,Copine-6,Copine-7,Copine-A,Copine-9 [Mytilus coruscus]